MKTLSLPTSSLRRSAERGHAEHGWLDSYHTFSFADYYDPSHMSFRSLRVMNEDRVAPSQGFGSHPHRDMEIITYVLSGGLQHKDSMGNGRVIQPGDFQYMSAGKGVMHSEFNPSPDKPAHFLQIWIMPDARGTKPRYAEKAMATAEAGRLHLITSKEGRDDSIAIHQDADLYLARFTGGEEITHTLRPGRGAWLQVAEGEVNYNGTLLHQGDAAFVEATAEETLHVAAEKSAQVLLFDLA